MAKDMIRVAGITEVKGLAQSIRAELEKRPCTQICAIGDAANHTASKAIASASSMMNQKLPTEIGWDKVRGGDGHEKSCLVYTVYR